MTVSEQIDFNTALPRFSDLIEEILGAGSLTDGTAGFLRDAAGVLTAVVKEELPAAKLDRVVSGVARLVPFVDPAFAVGTEAELALPGFLDGAIGVWERISVADQGEPRVVRLFDRRVIAPDWMTVPRGRIGTVPILVFASLKGGVGRSTALAVTAADLARRGKNVLVIDLDLEAPGLGYALLAATSLPRYGALDYFVEAALGKRPKSFEAFIGVSEIVQGSGLVHIVPATGSTDVAYPQNLITKMARATLDEVGNDENRTFLDNARQLVDEMIKQHQYDVVLIDARSGMSETTAAPILGLGADVLLFGLDNPQTFGGYNQLLAHLARFVKPGLRDDDWRWRLRMVNAKASYDVDALNAFCDRSHQIFANNLYDRDDQLRDSDVFNFDLRDPAAPHYPWVILNDSNYDKFDPIVFPDQLTTGAYGVPFGPYLSAVTDLIERRTLP